ncbi:MAG TPA: aminotransferase class V-fold PLP-dependent enzyme [Saprospiraceae bacterium]|nr:aminotransferase class V-fold PLP-dependent enzyme [Saprospiraceae bacterium]
MMNRRKFLNRATLSTAALPFWGSSAYAKNEPSTTPELSALSGEDYWKALRTEFPMPADQAYFNTGTMGAQPNRVLNAVLDNMRNNVVNIAQCDYQGNGPLLLQGYQGFDGLRTKIANLINARDLKEIALTQNATMGMNYISNGLDFKPGDEFINTNREHGGGFGGWRTAAKRYGLKYKEANIPIPANDPQEIFDNIFALVTPKTRVIAVPHILSTYGVVLPVKAICQEARKRGIFTIIDGAQGVGHVKVDVQDMGCDAYYSSLHKWLLAPAGNGILYVRKEVVGEVWTVAASYQWDNDEDHGLRLTQRGTGNISLIVGLEAAIDFHNEIGSQKVIKRIKELGDYLRAGLQEMDKVSIVSSLHPEMCAGITTYQVEGITPVELQNEMWKQHKLQPRAAGDNGLRQSTHIYNQKAEIDKALAVIKKV